MGNASSIPVKEVSGNALARADETRASAEPTSRNRSPGRSCT